MGPPGGENLKKMRKLFLPPGTGGVIGKFKTRTLSLFADDESRSLRFAPVNSVDWSAIPSSYCGTRRSWAALFAVCFPLKREQGTPRKQGRRLCQGSEGSAFRRIFARMLLGTNPIASWEFAWGSERIFSENSQKLRLTSRPAWISLKINNLAGSFSPVSLVR